MEFSIAFTIAATTINLIFLFYIWLNYSRSGWYFYNKKIKKRSEISCYLPLGKFQWYSFIFYDVDGRMYTYYHPGFTKDQFGYTKIYLYQSPDDPKRGHGIYEGTEITTNTKIDWHLVP